MFTPAWAVYTNVKFALYSAGEVNVLVGVIVIILILMRLLCLMHGVGGYRVN